MVSEQLRRVDTQMHIWASEADDRPWPEGGREAADRHRPAGPFSLDDALVQMAAAEVASAYLVPPSWHGERNDESLEAAREYPDRFRVMGRVQWLAPDAGRSVIADCGPDRVMTGVRVLLNTPRHWEAVRSGALDWIWPSLADRALPLMIFTSGEPGYLARLAREYPSIRFVVDHAGLTPAARGTDLVEAAGEAIRLASLPNVAVKASALPIVAPIDDRSGAVDRLLRVLLDEFGSKRVFWGSDLTRLDCTYREAVDQVELSSSLTGPERSDLMGGAVVEWVGWEPLSADGPNAR